MVYIGIGSNIGDREQYIVEAIRFLSAREDIMVNRASSLYETEPVGVKEQSAFYNAVIEISTILAPLELLDVCQDVEKLLGRVRKERWGPRTIDLDILVYDEFSINSGRLVLPHPCISERNFVLIPLAEIAGDLHVYSDKTVSALLRETSDCSSVTRVKFLSWE